MKNIFFSWQSDLDKRTHRNFIEKCIAKSIKSLNKESELHIYLEYDRDTLGLLGSPDISTAIFDKIDKCALFVADISNIATKSTRHIPNPNVLVELGYAIKVLGWDKIICFFDTNTGVVENLPFDIRQKRILTFNPLKENEDKRIIAILNENITSLFSKGKLANPLVDYMKGKVDKCLLDVCKALSNLIFESTSLSEGLAKTTKFLNLSLCDIRQKLEKVSFPAFIFLNEFQTTDNLLREILKDLFSSNYFSKEWPLTVLDFIDWLRIYRNITSPRDYDKFIIETKDTCSHKFAVISGHTVNPTNPPNSKIVLEVFYEEWDTRKYIDPDHGVVVNILEYPGMPKELEKIYRFNINKIEYLSNHIYRFIKICEAWLDLTDSEFILDPDFYQIGHF